MGRQPVARDEQGAIRSPIIPYKRQDMTKLILLLFSMTLFS